MKDESNSVSLPPDVEDLLRKFVSDLQESFGPTLRSAMIYGSAARGEYIPKQSNINVLVILDQIDLPQLKKGGQIFRRYRSKGVVAPLFLTMGYIATSADVFPMEFLDIKENHRLLFGDDPFLDVEIGRQNLRLQCEEEIKGKLIRICQSYVERSTDRDGFRALLVESLTSLLPAMRHLLYLDRSIAVIRAEETFSALFQAYGLEEDCFKSIWSLKRKKAKPSLQELENLLAAYILQINRLADIVDGLSVNVTGHRRRGDPEKT